MPERKQLTFAIPKDAQPTECRSCKALIYWIKPKDKPMPVNPDGVSHFATCPQAGKWRKGK